MKRCRTYCASLSIHLLYFRESFIEKKKKKESIHTRKATYQFSEKKASKELFYTLLTYSQKTHPILLRPFVENQKLVKIVL